LQHVSNLIFKYLNKYVWLVGSLWLIAVHFGSLCVAHYH